MLSVVSKVAELIFYCLTYEFNSDGDVPFSMWSIFMCFIVCGLVGIAIWCFIKGMSED